MSGSGRDKLGVARFATRRLEGYFSIRDVGTQGQEVEAAIYQNKSASAISEAR